MAHRAKHRAAVRAAAAQALIASIEASGAKVQFLDHPAPAPRQPRDGYEPGGFEECVLHGLQQLPHVYQGTVDPVTVAQRRAANRRARKARRRNRLADAHAVAWLLAASAIIGAATYYSAVPA